MRKSIAIVGVLAVFMILASGTVAATPVGNDTKPLNDTKINSTYDSFSGGSLGPNGDFYYAGDIGLNYTIVRQSGGEVVWVSNWTGNITHYSYSNLAHSDDVVYFTAHNNSSDIDLVAINRTNGETEWVRPYRNWWSNFSWAPPNNGSHIFTPRKIQTADDRLEVLNQSTGETVRSNTFDMHTVTFANNIYPAYNNNTFYAVSSIGVPYAWNMTDGNVTFDLRSEIAGNNASWYWGHNLELSPSGDTLYYTYTPYRTDDKILHAFNTTTGNRTWKYNATDELNGTYTAADNQMAIDEDGNIVMWVNRDGDYYSNFTIISVSPDGTFNWENDNSGTGWNVSTGASISISQSGTVVFPTASEGSAPQNLQLIEVNTTTGEIEHREAIAEYNKSEQDYGVLKNAIIGDGEVYVQAWENVGTLSVNHDIWPEFGGPDNASTFHSQTFATDATPTATPASSGGNGGGNTGGTSTETSTSTPTPTPAAGGGGTATILGLPSPIGNVGGIPFWGIGAVAILGIAGLGYMRFGAVETEYIE